MTNQPSRLLAVSLGLVLLAPALVQAQNAFQGGGQGANRRAGTGANASTREYPNNTQVGDATFSYDPETRKIIVVTDEDTNQEIKNVITSLDHPRPQVLIKVVFLEITHNKASDIGVEGAYKNGSNPIGSLAQAFGITGLNGAASNAVQNAYGQDASAFSPTPPGAGVYQVLGAEYQVTLKAIAQAGRAEILSRPSILARNNQPATISLGQEVPLVTNTRFDAVNGQINTVTYQNVGIILRVTPFITSDGMVEMIVSPETSQLADRSQWVPISQGALAPVINSRVADTVVVVPNGQTVVIGGLMATQATDTESKIPFLGDLPILGAAFKRKQKQNIKTELMIFLTPQIVLAPGDLAALTTEERERATLRPNSIPQQELDSLIDNLPMKGETGTKKKKK